MPNGAGRIALLIAVMLLAAACGGDGEQATAATTVAPGGEESVIITVESWREDDLAIWSNRIIPAFEEEFPNIDVEFNPSPPSVYDAALSGRLEEGAAGDLITCRPFDASLRLFEKGHLAGLNDLPGIETFSSVAQRAWITDDGSTPFCVPMASVIHGFIYNVEAFDQLGLSVPGTEEEFFQVLEAIAAEGSYVPLGMGTADLWEAATMGFQNIGPNYWDGEAGRTALIDGSAKFTDQPYVDTFVSLARWSEFLPPEASAVGYTDAQSLFTLGQAAIYPTGSWEIAGFNANTDFEYGAFRPPLPAGQETCYISDHTDIALGMNAASPNVEAARTFLSWVASPAFADLYANALPGFFSLQDTPVNLTDPVAREFVSWREECESTIRNSSQFLSRGQPNLEKELWATSAAVINGTTTPEEAAQRLQEGLDTWYTPVG